MKARKKTTPIADAAIKEACQDVRIILPKKMAFLMEMHPYKVLYGGRGGAKTESIGRALISLSLNQKLRILCAREIQNSIAESVHATLKAIIEAHGLASQFRILENKIICRATGSEFIFHGLHGHTVESIKSMAKLDIVWVEEAHTVSKHSWTVLLPTMREENAEVWVSFNPDMDTDDTWQRFVVHPPEGAKVLKVNWSDNKWFPPILEKQRQHCIQFYPDDYDNIWEGKCKAVVSGAIYAKEIVKLIEEGRYTGVPYNPKRPVHRIWDLGWNDAMSIIMVQLPNPTTLHVVNYMEGSFLTYAQWVAVMATLGYQWGDDWMPHDAMQSDPKSGTNAKKMLQGFGCKVKIIPKSNAEARIKAARMLFPRLLMNNVERKPPLAHPEIHHGCVRLMECLKRYKRSIPTTTGEPASPVHDQYSHGADALGGLAEIVDQIRNAGDEEPFEVLPAFRQPVQGQGLLG